jgi:uncharacterized protein (TIGR03437 family)
MGLVLLSGGSKLTGQAPATALTSNDLAFAHQIGTTAPPPQVIRVISTPTNLQFTATAQTDAPTTGWLLVNGGQTATGTTGAAATQDLAIQVNPASLVAGTYTGRIIVSVAGAAPNTANVTLTVTSNPQLRISPASLNLTMVSGESRAELLAIGSTTPNTPVGYNATVLGITPAGFSISVFPSTGNSGTNASVIINATGLQPGAAVAYVRFTSITSPSASVTVPITLNIATAPTLVVNPTTVNFGFQRTGALPTPKQVMVTSSTGTQLAYTATVQSGNWLSVSNSPGGPGQTSINITTPNPLYLIANPAAIPNTAVGSYDAVIQIQAPNVAPVTVNARLVISDSPLLISSLDAVTFNHTLGATTPASQAVTITTTGAALPFTVGGGTTTGGAWLSVTPASGSTPGQLQVALNPSVLSQLTAGTYAGFVRVTSASAANSPLEIPVTLNVSGSALITVEPASLSFSAQQGQTTPAQTFAVRSTDGSNQGFSLSVEPAGTNWLILDRTTGATGTTGTLVQVLADPARVPSAGTYDAAIVITPTGIANATPFRLPVRLTVTGATTVTATPAQLTFVQTGTIAPAAQTVTLSSTVAGLNYIASASTPWLTVTPTNGPVPGTLSVSVNPAGLTPGDLTGEISVFIPNVTTVRIPVTYRFQTAASLTATPSTVSLTADVGATSPVTQSVNLASAGAATPFTVAAQTTTGGNWLTVTPTSGTTNASTGAATPLQISANPSGLAAGTYNGTVTVTGGSAPLAINVALVVRTQGVPTGLTIVNAATGTSRGVSPGLIVTIKGRNMAPTTGMSAQVTNNVIGTSLGQVQVTFDGIPAPLLYVGPSGDRQGDQINAIVPYGLAGRTNTRMIVEYRGQRSEPLDLRIVETDPGIFTQSQTGTGSGAILNQNNAVNSREAAAARGSVIQIYATGEGQTAPAGSDGRVIAAAEIRRPMAPVSVRIMGQPAQVVYAGSAPTLVSGVVQINAVVPANLDISQVVNVPIEVQIGTAVSQSGVTVTLRP